jgi:hypothetical protein
VNRKISLNCGFILKKILPELTLTIAVLDQQIRKLDAFRMNLEITPV